ncbi:MAG TPA: c-type cytochrome [Chloroflexia bacterium]|nr:c-type cytochrome [Chloroflexia bacterium]
MRDKVILGVTLSIVLLLTLVVYGFIDANRGPSTKALDLETARVAGRHVYAQYCIQCHGPQGEGCIGPALNRVTWRPFLENGAPNPDLDEAAKDTIIRRTIEQGRNSNQPGIQMPAWSVRAVGPLGSGPLNDEQIDEVIAFIQYGDWSRTLEDAPSAENQAEPLPAYAGFTDKARLQAVKDLMLSKGCLTCHTLGKGGGKVAADLTDVGSRRDVDWLHDWIKDPKSVPAEKRGPNLFLVGPTATVPPPGPIPITPAARPTAQAFPMGKTYMPTIPLTDEELNLLVEYLALARTSTK